MVKLRIQSLRTDIREIRDESHGYFRKKREPLRCFVCRARPCGRSEWLGGQRDQEFRFVSGDGADGDGSAVGLDGAFDDGEAESGAFDFLLRVVFFHAEEAAENVWEIGAGDADAVVRDPDALGCAVGLAADFDVESVVRILFEGVFDEIEEDLRPVEAVAPHDERGVRHGDAHDGVLVADDGFEAFEDVFDAGVEAEGLDFQGAGFAGFQA